MTDPTATRIGEQAGYLEHSVGVRARPELRLLRLRGDDQREWLNGQVTADVRHTRSGDGVYALAVNVRGKILSDAWVLDRDGQLAVLLPESTYATVRTSFEQQIIMEDVELEDASSVRALSIQGPRAHEVAAQLGSARTFTCDELGHGGCICVVDDLGELEATGTLATQAARALGGGPVQDDAFELARIRAGRPWLGRDFGDRNYPQEAGLKGLAVSFSKGCYLGQEVVCTLEHRGRLSKRLVRLSADQSGLSTGDELYDGSEPPIGEVTSAVLDPETGRTLALGYVKHAYTATHTKLRTRNASVEVLGLAGAD